MSVALLQQLISIPSVNPMGGDAQGPQYYEGALTQFLMDFFEQRGIACECHEVVPGRSNVIARLEGQRDETVLLDAHQDTVPVDDMIIDPFAATVRDGKIYGRGACDVKGGLAMMLDVMDRLARAGHGQHPHLVLTCACDEEHNQLGAKAIVRLWDEDQGRSQLLTQRPDAAIVAEPTELDVVVAHRGCTRWKMTTRGVAAHSSDPSQGLSAVYRMARVVQCLEQYAVELQETSTPHPLCGPATLSVGRITGGTSVNVVPAECTIEIDRRVRPGEDGFAVIEQVEAYLRERIDFEIERQPPWVVGLTLSDENNGPLAERLCQAAHEAGVESNRIGVPFGTHASRYSSVGIPSVVFGPGSIAQAHTKDEWLSVEQLERGTEILHQFCVGS
ncbi:MAG: acetylornithine deacetylase [Blastopirellula sp.]|nr:acetylornithine deacetylase [Blastopirellula sp.]